MADVIMPEGSCGETYIDTSDDTIHSIDGDAKWSEGSADEGVRASSAILTFEVACRIAFDGVDPTQDSGTGLGHVVSSGDNITLTTWDQVNTIQWINKVNSSNGDVQITVLF